MDAMVDSHYQFGGKRVALALEADHLKGAHPLPRRDGAARSAPRSPPRARAASTRCPSRAVAVGDLEDLEVARKGADLLVANSNGRQAVAKLGVKAHLRTGAAGVRPARRAPEGLGRLPRDDEPRLRGGEPVPGERDRGAAARAQLKAAEDDDEGRIHEQRRRARRRALRAGGALLRLGGRAGRGAASSSG